MSAWQILVFGEALSFGEIQWLWLALPWLGMMGFCWHRQKVALEYLDRHVSDRFRSSFGSHNARSGRRHLGLLTVMGMILIIAAAQPSLPGDGDTLEVEAPDVLLMIDASASMNANDPGGLLWGGEEPPSTRFEAARRLARSLVEAMPDARFALISFSGVATQQLPLTRDLESVGDAIDLVEVHNFYQSTGSNLRTALEAVMPYAVDRSSSLQVVLLGDGEIPRPREGEEGEDYHGATAALARLEVPVHSVSIGSAKGENRLIYDFRDVVVEKEQKAVLREFSTRRVDRHFRKISRSTGGLFGEVHERSVDDLVAAIAHHGRTASIANDQSRRDITWIFVLSFLILWILERLLLGPREPSVPSFDILALGEPELGSNNPPGRAPSGVRSLVALVAVALGTVGGCSDLNVLELAHRVNEKGIGLDSSSFHGLAQRQYETSRGYGVRSEIPTYNQARSLMLDQNYAEAHRLFQAALALKPDLAEALFNDGVTLYEWGLAEQDPKACRLERTLDLWENAQLRFSESSEQAGDEDLEGAADRNYEFLEGRIEEILARMEDPPSHCKSSGGGAGEAEGGASEGGADSQDSQSDPESGEIGSQGEDPEAPTDPGAEEAETGDPPMEEEERGSQAPEPPGQPSAPEPPGTGSQGAGGESDSPGTKPDESPTQSPVGLSSQEKDEIQAALARIAEQGQQAGHYHRKSREEQFSKASWENPEAEIWW